MQNLHQNQMPLWEKLLQPEILAKLNCVYGISIPFIVGVYYRKGLIQPEFMHNSNCIKVVLEDIRSKNVNNIIIEDCVKGYKEEIDDIEKVAIIKRGHASISHTVTYGVRTFEFDEFIVLMWSRYQTQISNSTFSYDNSTRDWRVFSPSEEDIIDLLTID